MATTSKRSPSTLVALVALMVGLGSLGSLLSGCTAQDSAQASVAPREAPPPTSAPDLAPPKPQPDRSGRTRVGIASFYADWFAGHVMANGEPMDPGGANAASRTLPLGTTAKITNLSTGRSAVVTIQDRGPYAKGRLVDLSPATAEQIGITRKQGVARVKVSPIAVPLPDGTMRAGVAANDPEVAQYR